MRCPHCDNPESRVSETRPGDASDRRVRICRKCGKTFQTIERLCVYAGRAAGHIERITPGEEPEDPPAPKEKKAVRYVANPGSKELNGFDPEIAIAMCDWWNESRLSKQGKRATWTEKAWLGSVQRVSALPQWKQMILVKKGVEMGWQCLQVEFVEDILANAKPATGRLEPKSPAMQKALEQWHPY